jgi:photosystem II stability/assembly factor-like uncharacterized protein
LLRSVDGINWQAVASNTGSDLRGAAYGINASNGIGVYVAVGANGTLLTSPDSVTWTAQPAISVNSLSGVVYGTQFIAVGASGTILTSTDGTTWAAQPSGTANNLDAIVHATYSYSAVGASGVNLLAK